VTVDAHALGTHTRAAVAIAVMTVAVLTVALLIESEER
jgi:hypothetical protein